MDVEDKKHNEILGAISDLSKKTDEKIDNLSKKTDDLSLKSGSLTEKIDNLSEKTEEILEAIGHFSDKTEARFNALEGDVAGIKGDVAGIKGDVAGIKSSMVTKDYLDEKLSDLKGDLTVSMRKEDKKLLTLVNILETRRVISREDANAVLALEPFPQSR